jgi:methylphosphotriester-DNA--protein-cysteine methyltransferase
LPTASTRSIFLNGSAWEYPDFDNAETFVNRLARDGLISADDSVIDTLQNRPQEQSLRTSQQHVLEATGLTYSTIRQIQRARRATNLLKAGASILDVVSKAGYYDQAHLTRSLKRFVGQTPAQILRAEQQLSFLYKTGPT